MPLHPRVVAAVCALLLGACATPPADPEGTLERVRGGSMRVGITDNDPWVIVDSEPSGVEVGLIEAFAEELDASIEWIQGSEEELFTALELGELDLVIGGLTSTNAHSQSATFTHPFHTSFVTVGVPLDSDVEDIAGVEISVEPGTAEAGLLRKTDAVVVYVDDITDATGPAVVEDWMLDDLQLKDTGVRLSESDHVMALPFGENGWQVTLENFLLENVDLIDQLLDEQEP